MRTWKSVGVFLATVLVGTAGWASAAGAIAFTLDQIVSIDNATEGIFGDLRPVLDLNNETDTSGSHTDFGVVDFGTQDIFVVDLVLDNGSNGLDALGVAVGVDPFAAPVGGGYFNDGGGLITPATTDVHVGFSFQVVFGFSPDLAQNETTVRLFATYTGGMDIGQTATFMISPGINYTRQGTIVPEPGTALLVGAGLVAMSAVPRRKRL